MADFYDELTDDVSDFIRAQHMFFTGTAAEGTRINVSPKGMDTFRIFDSKTVGYLDVTGSGNETAAHIKNDGRLTIMLCGYEKKAWIVRIYGKGEVVRPQSRNWDAYAKQFEILPGTRQIILLHIDSVQTSCGWGVPKYEFQGHRDTLVKFGENKGEDGIRNYWYTRNTRSIDGLPTPMADEIGAEQ